MKNNNKNIKNDKKSVRDFTEVLRNVISIIQQSDSKNPNTKNEFKEINKINNK